MSMSLAPHPLSLSPARAKKFMRQQMRNCVGDRTRPVGRGSPSPSEGAQGFNMIPVSGVGEVVDSVSEAVGEEKIGKNRS